MMIKSKEELSQRYTEEHRATQRNGNKAPHLGGWGVEIKEVYSPLSTLDI